MIVESVTQTSKRNPQINQVSRGDMPVHQWYRFVLSFPPHLVRDYISEFKKENESFVLDPFCGTGTVLVESKKLSQPSAGIEFHPMTHFASTVKTNWRVKPDRLMNDAELIGKKAETKYKQVKNFYTLGAKQEELLLANSICKLPLHKLLILRDLIGEISDQSTRGHLLLALAKVAVGKASNLHFCPEVGVKGRKEDADVFGFWLAEVLLMAEDIGEARQFSNVPALALRGDSRTPDILKPTMNREVGLVITSPPYPNEKDYTRTTRLESVLLRFINSREELRNVKRGLIKSNSRTVYKGDTDHEKVAHLKKITALAKKIEDKRIELGKTSGFEKQYAKVVLQYFGGMARQLESVKPYLKRGAHLAYVVGDQASFFRIMIRTGEILKDIAQDLGYEHVRTDLFRERIATATGDFLREEVLILKWPK